MKRYRFLWIMIGMFCWGCEQNEIDLYDQPPMIDFPNSTFTVEFSDLDYLNRITEKKAFLPVRIIGTLLSTPLTYALQMEMKADEPNLADIRLAGSYAMPADTVTGDAEMLVKRPGLFQVNHVVKISFDFDSPVNQFDPGRSEAGECIVSVVYNIRPKNWNSSQFGIYSNNKYMFIMDEFGTTMGNIAQTQENKDRIRRAYAEYRKTNPPLLDDETPREEIVFPE